MFNNIAYAMGGQAAQGQGGGMSLLVPMIAMFAIFYFLMIRPQQKKQKEHQNMVNNLKKGNRVVTSGGIHGVVTKAEDTTVTLEIADKVSIKVMKGNIAIVQDKNSKDKPAKEKK